MNIQGVPILILQCKSSYFWRDNVGNEIDLLIEDGSRRLPVEIKSGQTITNEFFKGMSPLRQPVFVVF